MGKKLTELYVMIADSPHSTISINEKEKALKLIKEYMPELYKAFETLHTTLTFLNLRLMYNYPKFF